MGFRLLLVIERLRDNWSDPATSAIGHNHASSLA
jgi:hypothetical protein